MFSSLATWVQDVIEQLGYVGVALLVVAENVFPPIPSEIVLPFAGFVAQRGSESVVIMILAATVGSVGGALIMYWIAAVIGDAIAIAVFAYLSSTMRNRIIKRRAAKGKTGESPKFEKAVRMFDKYGIYGMAIAAPALIGTQIAAMASVAAGVKPFRTSTLIIASTLIWSAGIAIAMVAFDVRLDLS